MYWYYVEDKKKVGPISDADIERLVKQGKITPDTLVWNEVISKWQPYGKVTSKEEVSSEEIPPAYPSEEEKSGEGKSIPLAAGAGDTPKMSVCSECGKPFLDEEMIKYGDLRICATCKSTFFQKVREGVSLPHMMVYGGFWIRFGAKIIDGIIIYIVNTVFSLAAGLMTAMNIGTGKNVAFNTHNVVLLSIVYLFQISFNAAYATYFVGKFAATPGKMACGLKIVTADGGKVSYARALGRHFAEFLSSIILLIGYIMAAFDDEKRTLHDRICNTRVIKK